MRGGELVLALVVSKQSFTFTVNHKNVTAGKTKRNRKNHLAFKYLVDISCCQDVAKYQANRFSVFYVYVVTIYKSLVDQSVLLRSAKKCEHEAARRGFSECSLTPS